MAKQSCLHPESLDKTMWASLASLWSWFSARMRCSPSHAASCWACQHLPCTWPGCVWHIPALLNTAGKYWGHRLSVLAVGKSWSYSSHIQLLYTVTQICACQSDIKKNPCHFSIIFFGSIKRTEFPYLWLYRAFPVQHKQDYYRQRKDKRQ